MCSFRDPATARRSEARPWASPLEQVGVFALASCREGTCGTCETRVLEGTPEHRDSVLGGRDSEEGTSMMICVSRSRTPGLTLDL